MSNQVIQISNLSKTYHNGAAATAVLHNLDFKISQGEFVSIMGPSGSGKSTLMHILGALDIATSGHYFLDGIEINTLNEDHLADIRCHKIGFVFQAFNLLPQKTVLQNVLLPGIYGDLSGVERLARAKKLIALVRLENRTNHLANQLSGGQQQRVAIARSLMMDPTLILADEPTGNLPTDQTQEILEVFTRLNHEEGKTIVIITHEPSVAAYSKRTIFLQDGHIVSDQSIKKKTKLC